jgi:hypothetical protein
VVLVAVFLAGLIFGDQAQLLDADLGDAIGVGEGVDRAPPILAIDGVDDRRIDGDGVGGDGFQRETVFRDGN